MQFSGSNDYLTARFTSLTNFALSGERLYFRVNTAEKVKALALDHMMDDRNRTTYAQAERISLWETSSSNPLGGFALYDNTDPDTADDALLDLWTFEGLPHPAVTGAWDRAAAEAWLDEWITMAYDSSYLNIEPGTLSQHYDYLPYACLLYTSPSPRDS